MNFSGINSITATNNGIILYDGFCALCSHWAMLVIKRDPVAYFRFTPLQSEAGVKLQQRYAIDQTLDSIVLIDNGQCFSKSEAIIRIAERLNGLKWLAKIVKLLGRSFGDRIYDLIARHRYKIFKRKTICHRPPDELRERFVF